MQKDNRWSQLWENQSDFSGRNGPISQVIAQLVLNTKFNLAFGFPSDKNKNENHPHCVGHQSQNILGLWIDDTYVTRGYKEISDPRRIELTIRCWSGLYYCWIDLLFGVNAKNWKTQ